MNINDVQEKKLIALNKEDTKQFEIFLRNAGKYALGSDEVDLKIENSADGFTLLSINGVSYPVEIISRNQNEYEILVNGVSYLFSVETPFSIARKKILSAQLNESSSILLKAPMPGKILEVLVKAGDVVKTGDTLLILEAMKMQNAILASSKGIIKKVLVKSGDNTSKSDLLIEIEKE